MLSGGIILIAILFIFGNTIPAKKDQPATAGMPANVAKNAAFTTEQIVTESKKTLKPQQLTYLAQVENSVVRGDVKNQQIKAYEQLADFWMDTVHNHILGAYYIAEAAKLENSEKKLNFAARLLLENLMTEENPPMQQWLGNNTKQLFEKVLELNPDNDSAKVGIGASYMFGNISDQPMEGIMKIREVVAKDSTNVYAQMMLGMGGIRSGQFDKAIERFQKILKLQPNNLQAIFHLAETYDRMGDKANAIKWYSTAEEKVQIPEAKKDLRERIKTLQLN